MKKYIMSRLVRNSILYCFASTISAIEIVPLKNGGKEYRTTERSFSVYENAERVLKNIEIDSRKRQGFFQMIDFSDSGSLERIYPRKFHKSREAGVPLGKNFEFHKDGTLARKFISSGIDGGYGVSEPCDWEYKHDESGELNDKTFHKQKCLYGKGLITFFTPPGEYFVSEGPLRVRKEPNLKAATVVTLANDEKLTVIDFTTERLEINGSYAPWSKVKTAKGDGWVYGAYIEPVDWNKTYTNYFKNIDWQAFVKKLGLE